MISKLDDVVIAPKLEADSATIEERRLSWSEFVQISNMSLCLCLTP